LHLTRLATRFMRWFSAHWLALANLATFLYVGVPTLAPILMKMNRPRAGRLLYTLFSPLCHQLPERSFFLFGPRAAYSYGELARFLQGDVPRRYLGDETLGYKIAICQRDVAIYAAMFAAGLAFSALRKRLKPLPLKAFLALLLPLAVDGTGQLLGLWVSSPLSRVITGGLFGIALVWLAYPHLERGMAEVHQAAEEIIASWAK